MVSKQQYFDIRAGLMREDLGHIIAIEKKYTEFLTEVILTAASDIYRDFCQVTELFPFWVNYPPEQRGRKPRGTSIPWGDMGEKSIGQSLVRAISLKNSSVTYPGLPLGGDVRFATNEALVHFDMKLTGQTDNPHEIVASPHQISGDGAIWKKGVVNPAIDGMANSSFTVTGERSSMHFQPELPPFYVLSERVLICLTYFLKAVYKVNSLGAQPLDYMELVCVPNGLLMFDGPTYAQTEGLLIPGKDDKKTRKKRTRVRLNPLSELNQWRCIQVVNIEGVWKARERAPEQTLSKRASKKRTPANQSKKAS
jgi:hypothetical protein